jgi:hypothetical protein
MIRRSTLLWLLAAILVGSGLYQLKYEVQAKEERLARLNRQIQQEQEAIHVLHAEWAFLNRPDRLADLANRHLEMTPVAPAQFGKLAAIPERSLIPVAADAEAATTPAPVAKAHASAPAKPAPKVPAPAPRTQVVEAKRMLGTVDVAQVRAPAPARPVAPDVVVVVDGTLLAHAHR